jgi:hypothetical protein
MEMKFWFPQQQEISWKLDKIFEVFTVVKIQVDLILKHLEINYSTQGITFTRELVIQTASQSVSQSVSQTDRQTVIKLFKFYKMPIFKTVDFVHIKSKITSYCYSVT